MTARPMTRRRHSTIVLCGSTIAALVLVAHAAFAQQTIAIRDARIVPVSGPVIEKGTVVMRNGIIAEVGAGVAVPAGATVVDGSGRTVYPGLFDVGTMLGLAEVPGLMDSDDFSDLGDFTPNLMAFNAFHSNSVFVAIARSGGVLQVVTSPSGGTVPGQGAVMAMGGSTPYEMEILRHGPMGLDLPRLQDYVPSAYTRKRHPYVDATKDYQTRMKELTDFFAQARRYKDAKEKNPALARNAAFDAMIPILKGQQPVFIEAQSGLDIKKAVEFGKAQKLNFAVVGADDAPKTAAFLKENGVPVILGLPAPSPIREDDPYDDVCRAAATLHEQGVRFAFGSLHQTDVRSLRHDVGITVGCGLPPDVALRSVTLTPAEIVGVADKIGSIEKGKRANLVMTDGDIFEYGTHIVQTFVNGVPTGVRTRYTDLAEQYKDRK
jgi:imidazolonepropionase-like amidohydrolase